MGLIASLAIKQKPGNILPANEKSTLWHPDVILVSHGSARARVLPFFGRLDFVFYFVAVGIVIVSIDDVVIIFLGLLSITPSQDKQHGLRHIHLDLWGQKLCTCGLE